MSKPTPSSLMLYSLFRPRFLHVPNVLSVPDVAHWNARARREDANVVPDSGKEAKIVVPYRFIEQLLSQAEVVEELVSEDVVIPGENLFVEPAAFTHHHDRIGRENNRDGWMPLDEINDSCQPARLIRTAGFFWSVIDGANQDPSEQDQDDDQS